MAAVPDRDRRHLYEGLVEELGERRADTLMTLLPVDGWDDVARTRDLQMLETRLQSQFRHEMHQLFYRMLYANLTIMIALSGLVFTIARTV